ncbi:uncharacterized protein PG998_009863 [Apiospora kogelbergensis]|uniref:uncharacterized protein n=1 Tax=Apiospora kogelbergensis TaxID=1337665 RepID=UPI0031314DCF
MGGHDHAATTHGTDTEADDGGTEEDLDSDAAARLLRSDNTTPENKALWPMEVSSGRLASWYAYGVILASFEEEGELGVTSPFPFGDGPKI